MGLYARGSTITFMCPPMQLEVVWSTSEQFAQRCLRDCEEEANRHRLVYTADAEDAETPPPSARAALMLKTKRYEQARRLAHNARRAYEELAVATGKLPPPPDAD